MTEMELREKRFVVDSMLGKVAKWLRILGFDTIYERLERQEQIEAYRQKGFLLVTRTQRWCGQPGVFCPVANDPREQLREVVYSVPISESEARPLQRCIRCNRLLERISRETAFDYVPDYVFETSTVFYRCGNCQKVYWRGSHPKRMMERLELILGWSVYSNNA